LLQNLPDSLPKHLFLQCNSNETTSSNQTIATHLSDIQRIQRFRLAPPLLPLLNEEQAFLNMPEEDEDLGIDSLGLDRSEEPDINDSDRVFLEWLGLQLKLPILDDVLITQGC
jgi:hypothetical protein